MTDELMNMDALIVRHLSDLEAASARLNYETQKVVGSAIDEILKDWAGKQTEPEWRCKQGVWDNDGWVAPIGWRIPDSEHGEEEFFCQFWWDTNDAGYGDDGEWANEFWLTQLCGLGSGPIGFRWTCDYPKLGARNRNAWKNYLQEKNIIQTIQTIREQGFNYEAGTGHFFKPSIVSSETLADAIKGGNIEDALAPISALLKGIENTWKDFDSVFKQAQTHFSR